MKPIPALSGAERQAFIATNLPIAPAHGVPEIRLHLAQPSSGLRRLLGDDPTPPYWAYVWGGGAVLARHILDHPEVVAGRRVLDLGAGGGIAAIAAARAGAASVTAVEIDPNGAVALALNASTNGVAIDIVQRDITSEPSPPGIDLILASDVFYDKALARTMLPYLERCLETGIAVLIGDPYRKPLPLDRLLRVAEYRVPDFGGTTPVPAAVFSLAARSLDSF